VLSLNFAFVKEQKQQHKSDNLSLHNLHAFIYCEPFSTPTNNTMHQINRW